MSLIWCLQLVNNTQRSQRIKKFIHYKFKESNKGNKNKKIQYKDKIRAKELIKSQDYNKHTEGSIEKSTKFNTNRWSGANLNSSQDSRTKEIGKTDDYSIIKEMEFKVTKCTSTKSSEIHKLTNRISNVMEWKKNEIVLPKRVFSINSIMKAHKRHLSYLNNKIRNINASELLSVNNINVKQSVPLTTTSDRKMKNLNHRRGMSKGY